MHTDSFWSSDPEFLQSRIWLFNSGTTDILGQLITGEKVVVHFRLLNSTPAFTNYMLVMTTLSLPCPFPNRDNQKCLMGTDPKCSVGSVKRVWKWNATLCGQNAPSGPGALYRNPGILLMVYSWVLHQELSRPKGAALLKVMPLPVANHVQWLVDMGRHKVLPPCLPMGQLERTIPVPRRLRPLFVSASQFTLPTVQCDFFPFLTNAVLKSTPQ